MNFRKNFSKFLVGRQEDPEELGIGTTTKKSGLDSVSEQEILLTKMCIICKNVADLKQKKMDLSDLCAATVIFKVNIRS